MVLVDALEIDAVGSFQDGVGDITSELQHNALCCSLLCTYDRLVLQVLTVGLILCFRSVGDEWYDVWADEVLSVDGCCSLLVVCEHILCRCEC